tara:strand:- start:21 stop:761 length:741 start_codon:yes stop_codon:yes gene_type:complete
MSKIEKIRDFIAKEQGTPTVIVEVGSHWGQDTIRFVQAFKDVDIYSFEPNPISAEINRGFIRSALEGDEMKILGEDLKFGKVNFKLYESAVSNKCGVLDFFCTYRDLQESDKLESNRQLVGDIVLGYETFSYPGVIAADGSSLNKLLGDDLFKTIQVNAITLDNWYTETDVKHIDLLWVDVQGHEKSVIEGAKNMLKNIDWVILETDEQNDYEGAMSKQETVDFMESLSFDPITTFGSDVLFRRIK